MRSRNWLVCNKASSFGFDRKETSASTLGIAAPSSTTNAACFTPRFIAVRGDAAHAAHKPRLNVARKLARFGDAIADRHARKHRLRFFRRLACRDPRVFARRRFRVFGRRAVRTQEISLHTRRGFRLARVRVYRDEEVCSPRIGYGRPLFESDEAIRVARQYHFDIRVVVFDVGPEPSRYVKHQVFLAHAARTYRSRIVPAVTRINHYALDRRLCGLSVNFCCEVLSCGCGRDSSAQSGQEFQAAQVSDFDSLRSSLKRRAPRRAAQVSRSLSGSLNSLARDAAGRAASDCAQPVLQSRPQREDQSRYVQARKVEMRNSLKASRLLCQPSLFALLVESGTLSETLIRLSKLDSPTMKRRP